MALDSLEIQDGGGGGNRTLSPHRPKTLAGRGFSSIFKMLQNFVHPIWSRLIPSRPTPTCRLKAL
jgi:hypothetical protein